MPYITKILGNEPGIQYQGTQDKTGTTGAAPINNLIVGQFKRGRLDRPMTISKSNIRALLGYDPKNMDYVAVQDALDTGVPSVQVLRIYLNDCNCEDDLYHLTDIYSLSSPMEYGNVIYTLQINNQIFKSTAISVTSTSIYEGLNTIWADEIISSQLENLLSYYSGSANNGELFIQNRMNDCIKINLSAGLVHQGNINGPVYETRTLLKNLELCAFDVET
ncbi:hypothetical protein QDS01_17895 [Acinetobacter nosocomialis]|uniref:hypothetical protein n=1 Tax=Acinetobacter nosocomialis TaxID=106654 RepID=UPI002449F874|nr:hypothetical protein [Acinetobacter nosocomialis]MDH2636784.1 hypothetical protein [Acinetobacter nosocomialis]